MAANTGFAIAQAHIRKRMPPLGLGQALADIKTPNIRSHGQAMTSIVKFAKQTGFGQAHARISNPYHWAQAQAEIVQG